MSVDRLVKPRCFGLVEGILLAALLAGPGACGASTYYVDASNGDDSWNGRYAAYGGGVSGPWRTLAKVNAHTFSPGDAILLKRGERWREQLTIPSSGVAGNPVSVAAYGTGAAPAIDGADRITGWSVYAGSIYSAPIAVEPNQLFVDGQKQVVARWPNSGWLTIDADATNMTSLYSEAIVQPTDYWKDAYVVFKPTHWCIARRKITGNSGSTLHWQYDAPFSAAQQGYGFFMEGKREQIDAPGEWTYRNGNVYLYWATDPNSHVVECAVRSRGIALEDRHDVTIREISVTRTADDGLYVGDCDNVEILSNTVSFAGGCGIVVEATSKWSHGNIRVRGNRVERTTSAGIALNKPDDVEVAGNVVENIGMDEGSPRSSSGMVVVTVRNGMVAGNRIANTGDDGISVGQCETLVISRNDVSGCEQAVLDGGGIYVWGGNDNKRVLITDNVFHEMVGNRDGTPYSEPFTVDGIYLDNGASGFIVRRNTVYDCPNHGVMLHGGESNCVFHNTIYDSGQGTALVTTGQDSLGDDVVRNNLCLGAGPYQAGLLMIRHAASTRPLDMRNNLYYNPHRAACIAAKYLNKDARAWYTLSEWQAHSGLEHDSLSQAPLLVDVSAADFRPRSESPCIDAGAFLTETVGSGSGTAVPVQDAHCFMDGWGLLEGDLIQFEGQTVRARVIDVDYEAGVLILDRSLSWTAGQGVSPAYEGTAPDIGACEFVPAVARVSSSADDAEERLDTGAVSLTSSDIELVRDGTSQLVGVRFTGIEVPPRAVIEAAWLEFTTDEASSETTALVIQGQAADNAAAFTTATGNISSRSRTAAAVDWAPGAWDTIGEARQSPDISAVVQEIVEQSGWQSGNALAILISGSGRRVADSYDGDPDHAPALHLWHREAPGMAVSTTKISVSGPEGSDCPEATFQVWNSLNGTLRYQVVESTGKFSIAPSSGTSTGSTQRCTHTIHFTTADLPAGTYERSFTVEDDGSGSRNGPLAIQVHIEITPPPSAPAGFAATPLSASSVRLSWTDLANETEYMLRRSLDGVDWYAVPAVYPPANTTEYIVSGLSANTTYYFKLRGINGSGYGPYCEPVRVTSTRVSAGAFDAYNDLCWTASEPAANITVLTRAESGALRDYGTGEYIPVTLTLNAGGGTSSAYGADAAAGTEADDIFGGIVDGRGVLHYAQTELTLTIAGLDSARLYELTLFGNRANPGYTARTTILTLEGADRFVNASSPDVTVTTTTMTDDTAVIVNGYNTANGAVARYDRIVPGADGGILVRVPAWSGSGDAGRYYLNALRLRTVEPPPLALARGAEWRYRKGTAEASEPASAWRQAAFDDSGWARGSAPVGYGAPAAGGTVLSDMRYNYTSIFVRRTFEVTDPLLVGAIDIEVDYDDGFILWLNGREVARVNVAGEPGSFVPCNATASTHGNSTLKISLTGAQLPKLVAGPNAIAAQVFNISLAGSSDCVFDAELDVVLDPPSRSTDADQNNLADDWEQAHLSDLSDPADRSDSGDPDGDGACNLEEWVAGSDPRVPGSVFGVQVGVQGGQVVVSFVTVPATGPGYDGLTRHYALESRPADSTSEWRAVPGSEDIPGAGQTVTFTAGPEVDARFYRSRVWLE